MATTKKYKVMVHGKNFLLPFEGEATKMGFYTTLFLDATDSESADFAAAESLRSEPKLRRNVRNERYDPPLMVSERIEEVESFDGCHLPRTGFVFYREIDESATEQSKLKAGECQRFEWPEFDSDP